MLTFSCGLVQGLVRRLNLQTLSSFTFLELTFPPQKLYALLPFFTA
jgi:hypothetical protein